MITKALPTAKFKHRLNLVSVECAQQGCEEEGNQLNRRINAQGGELLKI